MKKLILAVLVTMFVTSCAFKSVEKPIDGTKSFVTYSLEGTSNVGIKEVGEQGKILTGGLYRHIVYRYDYFMAQIPGQEVKWKLLDKSGEPVSDNLYDNIWHTPDHFTMVDSLGKYFVLNGTSVVLGPNDDYLYAGLCIFVQKDGKWGFGKMLAPEWEKIILLREEKSQDVRLVVKTPAKNEWKIFDENGIFIKKTTAAAVKKMEAENKKFSGKKWGNENLYGLTVKSFKKY